MRSFRATLQVADANHLQTRTFDAPPLFPLSPFPGRIPPRSQPVRKGNPMRSRLLLVLITLTFCAAAGISPAYAQKRNISEKDLFNFVWAADPQISPDGSRVAFVR